MRFERLQLRNFQSYDDADLSFDDGVTMIQGSNGAGKSTLLRAIFGGLFQTNATKETSSDYSLADFVTRGEDEGAVTLTFSVGGVSYTVEWVIRVTEDDDGERKGSTKSCTMTSPAFTEPIEGVRDVRKAVEGLIGMGATEFANSVYVQQKRFSRLVEANERERKEILDALLGLSDLDTYADRMKRARRPAKRKRNEFQSRLQEVQDRIDQYDKSALRERRSELESEIESKEDDLDTVSEKRSLAQRRVDHVQAKIDNYEDTIERREELLDEIDEKKETLNDLQTAVREAEDRIDVLQNEIAELQEGVPDTVDGYNVSTLSNAEAAMDTIQGERDDAFATKQEAKQDLEQAKTEKERLESQRSEAQDELDAAEDALDESCEMLLSRLSSFPVDAAQDTLRQDMREAARQWAADAPVVEPSDDVDEELVNEQVETVDEKREELGNDLSQLEAQLEQLETERQSVEAELAEAREEYEQTKELLSDDTTDPMDAYDDAMAEASDLAAETDLELNGRDALSLITDDIAAAHDAALNAYHELATGDGTVDELETRRDKLARLNDLTQVLAEAIQYEDLATTADRIEELEAELTELDEREATLQERQETKQSRRERLQSHVERGSTLATLFGQLDTLTEREEAVADAEETVSELADAIDEQEDAVAAARDAFEEAATELEEIEETQAAVEDVVETHETIEEKTDEIASLERDIEQTNDRMSDIRGDISSRRDDLSDIEDQIDGDDIDDLREEKEKAEAIFERADENKDRLESELDGLKQELTRVTQELESLEDEKQRAQRLQDRAQDYDDLVTELTEMIEVYDEVKVTLREQTLDLLNQYTNQVFDDLYESESYIGVRIDQDYRIRLVTGDNEEIDPDKCSGGEGVITNIALRAGVYRVIAEQDESGGDALPPFILDEPTNHLDDEHVSQIEDAIESIQDWNVPQVFVVSHQESLLTSADHTLYVEKDPATNRSVARFINLGEDEN